MDINAGELFASLLISLIGIGAFMYGKRQGRVPQMLAGLVLCLFPYFVSNVLLMFGIAIVVLGGMWGALKLGW